jgi:predicted porin
MKHKLGLLIVSSALSTGSYAQSSVSLYGVIDLGINYASNARTGAAGSPGATQFSLTSGTRQGSRWGFRGAEDLGSGYKAIFRLENGFTANNGAFAQGGAEFGRQAYVGLSGPKGTVTLGRQYDFVVDFVSPFVANRYSGFYAAHPDDLDNLNLSFRVNNAIKYASGNYRGFQFGALYGFGGIAGNLGRNQVFSLGAHYEAGPLKLGVGYVNARDPNLSLYGNNPNGGTASVNNIGANNPVIAGFASASTLQIIAAGGAYTVGPVIINAIYTNTQYRGLGDLSAGPNPNRYTGNVAFHNAEIGVRYLFRRDLNFGLSYNFTHGTGVDNGPTANYNQVNLGIDYLLSKRSDVYLLAGYQRAKGHDSTSRTASAVASFVNSAPSATDDQTVVRVGLRHTF